MSEHQEILNLLNRLKEDLTNPNTDMIYKKLEEYINDWWDCIGKYETMMDEMFEKNEQLEKTIDEQFDQIIERDTLIMDLKRHPWKLLTYKSIVQSIQS